jgi:hypothetical protein
MVSREETDLKQAEKYGARWIIGKNLIFPNRFGVDITSSGSIEFRDETPTMEMDVKITPITDKTTPEDLYNTDSGRMHIQPEAVYLDIETARSLAERLKKLCRLHPSIVGEVSLYDPDDAESLITVCTLSGPDVTPKKVWNIKWEIKNIGRQYHAELLTYELNENGKWISIDWNPGLKYKDRVAHTV